MTAAHRLRRRARFPLPRDTRVPQSVGRSAAPQLAEQHRRGRVRRDGRGARLRPRHRRRGTRAAAEHGLRGACACGVLMGRWADDGGVPACVAVVSFCFVFCGLCASSRSPRTSPPNETARTTRLAGRGGRAAVAAALRMSAHRRTNVATPLVRTTPPNHVCFLPCFVFSHLTARLRG